MSVDCFVFSFALIQSFLSHRTDKTYTKLQSKFLSVDFKELGYFRLIGRLYSRITENGFRKMSVSLSVYLPNECPLRLTSRSREFLT